MIQFIVSSLALPAGALTLDDLKRPLSELRGETPIAAAFDVIEENEAQNRKRTNRSHADVEERNGSVRLIFPTDALSRAAARTAASADPGFARIDEVDAYTFLNFAPELLRELGYATITKQAPATWQGRPVTRVDMKLNPPTSPEADKFIKSRQASLTLYVGSDGLPVASARAAQVKGRVLIVPFQASNSQSAQFQKIGDRLVVTRNEQTGVASGFGQEGSNKTVTTVSVR